MRSYLIGLVGAVVWVFLLNLHAPLTITSNDQLFYLDMATQGITDNEKLVSPFAYRFFTPLLAGWLYRTLDITPYEAFYLIALVCAVLQLWLVYLLARRFTDKTAYALLAMSVVAISYYNVRFLLADPRRPDHLAYPLMVLAILLLLADRRIWALLVALFGMMVREFLLIPVLLVGLSYGVEFLRRRRPVALLLAGASLVGLTIAFLLPRVLIHVRGSTQYLDFFRSDFYTVLVGTPLNMGHNINVVLALWGYWLPTLLLVTRPRWRKTFTERRRLSGWLFVYQVLVFGLMFYGGTDISRFVTYYFIPQTIFLALLLKQDLPRWEIAYMLVAVAIFNRLFEALPTDMTAYLDGLIAFSNVINATTLKSYSMLAAFMGGMWLLRRMMPASQPDALSPAQGEAGAHNTPRAD